MDKIKLFTDWVPRIQSNKKLEPPKFAVSHVDILQRVCNLCLVRIKQSKKNNSS